MFLSFIEWKEFTVDEYLYEVWLDNSYGGAPDECSDCYRDGKIVKIVECEEHG